MMKVVRVYNVDRSTRRIVVYERISTPVASSQRDSENLNCTPSNSELNASVTPVSINRSQSKNCLSNKESLLQLLSGHPKTRDIDFSKKALTIEERKKVLAAATSKLVELETVYPSTESKVRLARVLMEVTGVPQGAFFDPASHRGYVNKYLDNLRCKLSPSKRRYSWKKKLSMDRGTVVKKKVAACSNNDVGDDCENATEVEVNSIDYCPRGVSACNLCEGIDQQTSKDEVARINAISSSRQQEVLDGARRSLCYRQVVHLNVSFATAVSQCNKYQTMPELLLQDFRLLYGENACNTMLTGFSSLVTNVIDYARSSKVAFLRTMSNEAESANDNVKTVCAIKCLLHLLPDSGKSKLSASEAFTGLIIFVPISESVEQHALKPKPHQQPLLAIQGDFSSYNILCEQTVCCAGSSIIESLDILFKFIWVFKMHYPVGLKMFYTFLQRFYGLKDGKDRFPSRVEEIARIFNIPSM